MAEGLRARHRLAMTFDRSVGGAVERFLAGLAAAELWGSVAAGGAVVVPPVDHDGTTGQRSVGFVQLAGTGVICTWTWVAEPAAHHPLTTPFAYALVQLDGAATSLLHVVDVPDESMLREGLRVRVDWRSERTGSVLDIRAFVVDDGEAPMPAPATPPEEVRVVSHVDLGFDFEPGLVLSGFFRALAERRITGGRCPTGDGVYVPPRPACPRCGAGPMEPVALGGTGTIVSYAVIHLPNAMDLPLPFAWAWILLDGADVPFAHLLGEVDPADVAVGQRVEAVWVPDDDLEPSWESIRWFRPVPGSAPASLG